MQRFYFLAPLDESCMEVPVLFFHPVLPLSDVDKYLYTAQRIPLLPFALHALFATFFLNKNIYRHDLFLKVQQHIFDKYPNVRFDDMGHSLLLYQLIHLDEFQASLNNKTETLSLLRYSVLNRYLQSEQ